MQQSEYPDTLEKPSSLYTL